MFKPLPSSLCYSMDKFVVEELLRSSISDWSDDTSTSSSDSETAAILEKQRRDIENKWRQPQRMEDVFGAYNPKTFQSHFRISQAIVYNLIDVFNHSQFSPANQKGKLKVSNEKAFLITLWYLSNTESFRQVSDRFRISLSTGHGVLLRVLNFILSLTADYIRWPSAEEARIIGSEFKNKKEIHNIIGVVDGCHVKIIKPRDDIEVYVNRKGYHSLLLQGIVNSKKMFTDVYCGEPGSLYDAQMLRKSGIFTKAKDPSFFGNFYLIGDSAYPSLPWLVPPFQDNGSLTQNRKVFNDKLASTRIVVEHAFGLLKGRFRRLQYLHNIDLSTSVKCIMACCIVHNICIKKKDDTVIVLADIADDLISDAPPFDSYIYGRNRSRREEVFEVMFKH